MRVAIVGAEQAKFTVLGARRAVDLIRSIVLGAMTPKAVVISGHCHLGGIDIWAEEAAASYEQETEIYPPAVLRWSGTKAAPGFRERNISIARACQVLHNISVDRLPEGFKGRRFDACYHCPTNAVLHVKSGGCWTMNWAKALGKPTFHHVIENY